MRIKDMDTKELLDVLLNGRSMNERSMTLELFSRMPYWGMPQLLIVPVNSSINSNGQVSIRYVRGYREIIRRFTLNGIDHLMEATKKAPYIPRPETLKYGFAFRHRNVMFIDTDAPYQTVATATSSIMRDLFVLCVCPDTQAYNDWYERVYGSLDTRARNVVIRGTNLLRSPDTLLRPFQTFALKTELQPLSPLVKRYDNRAVERQDWLRAAAQQQVVFTQQPLSSYKFTSTSEGGNLNVLNVSNVYDNLSEDG